MSNRQNASNPPHLNSVPLRRIIKRHGNLGYAIVGAHLLAYWLLHIRRRQTLLAAGVALAACVGVGAYISTHLTPATPPCSCTYHTRQTDPKPQAAYTITDLGVTGNFDYSWGYHVNNQGQTAGDVTDEEIERVHAFFSDADQCMVDIGTLGGATSTANAINDAGQIAGGAELANESFHGFVWQNRRMTDVGTLGGEFSTAFDINSTGQAVGVAETDAGLLHAFVWKDGKITDIGAQCPGEDNIASVINDNGDFGGVYFSEADTIEAFARVGSRTYLIPTLGGTYTQPRAMSRTQVVGYGFLQDDSTVHGFIWQPDGIRDIGTLGGKESWAIGVNERGQVVGDATDKNETLRAVLWQNGRLTDLNTLIPANSGWSLYLAGGINNRGQIVGTGYVSGKIHAFLLTPRQ